MACRAGYALGEYSPSSEQGTAAVALPEMT